MKAFFKKYLQKILFRLSRAILKKYRPKVIGITGSVGKSSAKEAVFAVAREKFRVRQNIKNYNNEIGLPLTIIGEKSPGASLFGWLKLFGRALKLILLENERYPEILILEMGADRLGDMAYLTDLAPADIGVVANVGPSHLEYFKTVERVAKEKSILVTKLKPGGWGVLNIDNEKVAEMKNSVRGRFLTYGFSPEAQVRAIEIDLSYRGERLAGTSFKLAYDGKVVPVFLENVLADYLVYAALSAACVGIILEMNLVEIAEALKDISLPAGRMRLLVGINNSQLIDDTYNANPESTAAAVRVLGKIESSGRKLAVLGDMLELGDYEQAGHRAVGRAVAEAGIDRLICVGERAELISAEALKRGLAAENIFDFPDSISAGDWLVSQIKHGDLVLIKGSQGMRMERVTKALLADPSRAKDQLVRQEDGWLK